MDLLGSLLPIIWSRAVSSANALGIVFSPLFHYKILLTQHPRLQVKMNIYFICTSHRFNSSSPTVFPIFSFRWNESVLYFWFHVNPYLQLCRCEPYQNENYSLSSMIIYLVVSRLYLIHLLLNNIIRFFIVNLKSIFCFKILLNIMCLIHPLKGSLYFYSDFVVTRIPHFKEP